MGVVAKGTMDHHTLWLWPLLSQTVPKPLFFFIMVPSAPHALACFWRSVATLSDCCFPSDAEYKMPCL